MTIRTVDLGGTAWADGDVLFAADLNDTYGAVTIHRKQFTFSTETTKTSNSFQDTTTFTLSTPVNAILIGLRFQCQMKTGGGSNVASATLKITGSNLGTQYLQLVAINVGSSETGYIDADQNTMFQTASGSQTYVTFSIDINPSLKLLDASTSLVIQQKSSIDTNDNIIRNMEVDAMYIEVFKDD